MTIVIGILCLGFIVLIHEFGHFIAARLCGVEVESFSIGMGPVIFHKTVKNTDYRLSLLPLGGYCGMKGEQAFRDAIENNLSSIPQTPGSFYGVAPYKRAIIAFAGPAMNVLFAVLAFIVISMVGYTFYSADNRIVLANEVYPDTPSIAADQGLKTGDKIVSVDGKKIETFADITQEIGTRPDQQITVTVDRNGELLDFTMNTAMDSQTGLGKIGVANWIDPVIYFVEENSLGEKAGLLAGDTITSINDREVLNTFDITSVLSTQPTTLHIQVLRGNTPLEFTIDYTQSENLGIQFSLPAHEAPRFSFFPAIWQGIKETGELISLTFKSIAMLFKGIDLSKAVSGPVQITVMLGDTVQSGFDAGFRAGLVSTLNFLALISVSLFIMNLLPIPVLDGGLVLFALIETIRSRPVRPRIIYNSQFIGIGFIVLLLGIALFSDANYVITHIFRR